MCSAGMPSGLRRRAKQPGRHHEGKRRNEKKAICETHSSTSATSLALIYGFDHYIVLDAFTYRKVQTSRRYNGSSHADCPRTDQQYRGGPGR